MELLSIFFIFMTLLVLGYILFIVKDSKRIPVFLEIFYLGIYGFVLLVFLFPQVLRYIEVILGVNSAINFIIYLSVFVSYLLIFVMYGKLEDERCNVTKLVREISYLKKEIKGLKKK